MPIEDEDEDEDENENENEDENEDDNENEDEDENENENENENEDENEDENENENENEEAERSSRKRWMRVVNRARHEACRRSIVDAGEIRAERRRAGRDEHDRPRPSQRTERLPPSGAFIDGEAGAMYRAFTDRNRCPASGTVATCG